MRYVGWQTRASSAGTALLALALAAAGPPSPAKPGGTQSAAPVKVAPLPLPRSGPQPIDSIRALSMAQDKMARGEDGSSQQQKELSAKIGSALRAFPAEVWKDPRNRQAVIKFSLSGGTPDQLRTLIGQRVFLEAELPLAEGALAYAEGQHVAAEAALGKVDGFKLGASLGGHVSLIKAILSVDSDPAKAQRYAAEARLLSPGTLVEESALRIAIELASRRGDATAFQPLVSRYFRRYARSVFAITVSPLLADFAATRNLAKDETGRLWLEAIAGSIAEPLRFEFYAALAGNALRRGHLATAVYGAQLAGKQPNANAGGQAIVSAYEGAARVIDANPKAGLAALIRSERTHAEPAVAELISASRFVAQIITAPPQTQASGSARPEGSAKAVDVRNRVAGLDKLLQDTAQ